MPNDDARLARRPWGFPVTNHYQTLGVSADANAAAIRAAYLRKSRVLHPDRHVGQAPDVVAEATMSMAQLNEAWSVLRSADLRREYDASLGRAPREEPAPTGPSAPAPAPPRERPARAKPSRTWIGPVVVVLVIATGGWAAEYGWGAPTALPEASFGRSGEGQWAEVGDCLAFAAGDEDEWVLETCGRGTDAQVAKVLINGRAPACADHDFAREDAWGVYCADRDVPGLRFWSDRDR